MGYQALYRVFRPQQFEDVVGQEHITKTLQNALLQRNFLMHICFLDRGEREKPVQLKYLRKQSTVSTPL